MEHSNRFNELKPILEPHKDKPWFRAFLNWSIPYQLDMNLMDLAWIAVNWKAIPIITYYEKKRIDQEKKEKRKKKQQQYFRRLYHIKAHKKYFRELKTTVDWRMVNFADTFPFSCKS